MNTMKKILAAGLIAAAVLPGAARAAQIEETSPGLIYIHGNIVNGDYDRFRNIASQHRIHTVLLTSNGGNVADALRIGLTIRNTQAKTVALGDCYSACAMIWLSGYRKAINTNATIGFHVVTTEKGQTTGLGNAIIGKYMADLGYSYKFILATLDGEHEFRVLTVNDVDMLLEEFSVVAFPTQTEQDVVYFLAME